MDKLDIQLGPTPVTSFGVVADLTVSFQTEPVGKWLVLFHLFSQYSLDTEGLNRGLK
jgi:hypothetical protein